MNSILHIMMKIVKHGIYIGFPHRVSTHYYITLHIICSQEYISIVFIP